MKSRRDEKQVSTLLVISVEAAGAVLQAPFTADASVLDTLLDSEIEISHSCGGMGTCGTCRIEILSPLKDLHERNEVESEMAADRDFAAHERLACQLHARVGLKIRVPHST